MTVLALAAATTVPSLTVENVLAAIKEQAQSYETRPLCGVTVAASVDSQDADGPIDEDLVIQFDRETEDWSVLEGPADGGRGEASRRQLPVDWYDRALMIASAAERAESQDDGSFLLYTENMTKGTLISEGRDNSNRSRASTRVALVDGELQITGYSVSLKKPFRIPLIIRVGSFTDEIEFGKSDDHGPLASQRMMAWDLSRKGREERGAAEISYLSYDCPA